MSTVHKKTVVTADDGVSEVGSDEWNDRHATSLVDTEALVVTHRQVLAGTDRLTAAATAELRVLEQPIPFVGAYLMGSPTIVADNYVLQYKRASLAGNGRATLQGTAELFIFDLAPVGRLVLAGRGG